MVLIVEEKNLSDQKKVNIISSLGENIVFCSPDHIECVLSEVVVFADIYFEALSFCLIKGLEIQFLYGDKLLSRLDIDKIKSLQENLLREKNYIEVKKLNLMTIFLEVCGKRSVLSSLPTHLQLEHTTFCNARCIMCDHYVSHNRGSKHLRVSTVHQLKSILPYVSLIIMHGNGEPFLNPAIVEILELYKQYEVRISTNTNLSYINDDICLELNQMCEGLQISCDACDKETYEGIRQGLSFDTFCDNLDRIMSLSEIKRISLEVDLMQQNIRQAKDIVAFAHSYGIKTVRFHDLGVNGVLHNESYSLRHCSDIANKYISQAKEAGAQLGVLVKAPVYDAVGFDSDEAVLYSVFPGACISDEMHQKYGWYTNQIGINQLSSSDLAGYQNQCAGICEYPFAKSYMDLNGNVSVCCPSSRKVVGHVSSMEDFEQLWNSQTMIRIRDLFYAGMIPSFCKSCFMMSENSLSWIKHREEKHEFH